MASFLSFLQSLALTRWCCSLRCCHVSHQLVGRCVRLYLSVVLFFQVLTCSFFAALVACAVGVVLFIILTVWPPPVQWGPSGHAYQIASAVDKVKKKEREREKIQARIINNVNGLSVTGIGSSQDSFSCKDLETPHSSAGQLCGEGHESSQVFLRLQQGRRHDIRTECDEGRFSRNASVLQPGMQRGIYHASAQRSA